MVSANWPQKFNRLSLNKRSPSGHCLYCSPHNLLKVSYRNSRWIFKMHKVCRLSLTNIIVNHFIFQYCPHSVFPHEKLKTGSSVYKRPTAMERENNFLLLVAKFTILLYFEKNLLFSFRKIEFVLLSSLKKL